MRLNKCWLSFVSEAEIALSADPAAILSHHG